MNRDQRISPEEYARRIQRPATTTLADLLAARPDVAEIGVAAAIAQLEVSAC